MPALRASIASNGVGAIAAALPVSRLCRLLAISNAPQANSTTTSHGPMIAVAIRPDTRDANQRNRAVPPLSLARRQLAGKGRPRNAPRPRLLLNWRPRR